MYPLPYRNNRIKPLDPLYLRWFFVILEVKPCLLLKVERLGRLTELVELIVPREEINVVLVV